MTVAALGGFGACGPSVQTIYEGNVRFEHCYRLDLDREVAPSHREVCWREWVETYSYGQTRDRVEYARRRLRYLAAGETSPPGLVLAKPDAGTSEDGKGSGASRTMHAPPPTLTEPSDDPPSRAAASASSAPSLPGQPCVGVCATTRAACVRPCQAGNGRRQDCEGCDQDYGRCMRRCFEERPSD
ncbi:MAG: hypothetical protein JW751_07965 [Polyangiaceae bacterium]|nr:hypothetical protein [Polyangiaceae bacterium]